MRVRGTITRVEGGLIKNGPNVGKTWQALTFEGIRVFVPVEMINGWERGQRVNCELMHKGDTKIVDASGGNKYLPEFELLNIERVMVAD